MKIFNLKAVGDKIKAIINNKYDLLLNKIAIKSKAYKALYNEYNNYIIVNKYLPEISNTIENTAIGSLVKGLFNYPGIITKLNTFDTQIIRLTELNDILIVSDPLEKHRVQEEMKYFSGSGQVFTLEEITKENIQLRVPIGKIYVFSSIWLRDLLSIENLSYRIKTEKEESRL